MADPVAVTKLHRELPIFALSDGHRCVIYLPGHVMPATSALVSSLGRYWRGEASDASPRVVGSLERQAGEVVNGWATRRDEVFRPECLNVQLTYSCDLACTYCFARDDRPLAGAGPNLDEPALMAAAEVVAAGCVAAGCQFHLVVNGLGEPTSRWDDLTRTVALTKAIAGRHGLDWFGHVTTNGQGTPTQARWLAEQFSSVALSCDGPPEIQDRRRPRRDGGRSSAGVEQTAQVLRAAGVAWEVRATVAPDDAVGLSALVHYVGGTLGATALRVETTFRQRDADGDPASAEAFVAAYLQAERAAECLGLELDFAGLRLTEWHGPFCEAARHVLRLLPDRHAVNCMCNHPPGEGCGQLLGGYDQAAAAYWIDQAAAARWRRLAFCIPATCRSCLNQYHCDRTCPDGCPWDDPGRARSFRCALRQALAAQLILRAAADLDPPSAVACELTAVLAELPESIDGEAILAAWSRAANSYRMADRALPAPPWADGFTEQGQAAWPALRDAAETSVATGLSVYVHVPFCEQRCSFCDCHSLVAGGRYDEEYLQVLLDHLRVWVAETGLGTRPVTTVHFGGGTPLAIGAERLGWFLCECQRLLCLSSACELAVETTAGLCDETALAQLQALGFTRLHVGVQTFDDGLRALIGRRTPSAEVLRRLGLARTRGLVTSVDLVYGLPGQTVGDLVADVIRLAECGVDGVSLYHLNLSRRNRRLQLRCPDHQPDHHREFVMLQAAEQALTGRGFAKTHFVHYARPADQNLYYRHALRGEDLLGLGASASGVFGSLEYQYRPFPACGRHGRTMPEALAGTVRSQPTTRDRRALIAGLMCGEICVEQVCVAGLGGLLERWRQGGLVVDGGSPTRLVLTATGSWLLSQMIGELLRA